MTTHVHASDPITSHLAALQHEDKRPTNTAKVFAEIVLHPGLCAEQIGEQTGLGRVEAARRISDLKSEGHVRYEGRMTYGGTSQSRVYAVSEPTQGNLL